LALGLVSLCNHSPRPCAGVERNHARQTIDLIAQRAIMPDEEITIDYNCPLWFEPVE
jgi:SET domain-containing protein